MGEYYFQEICCRLTQIGESQCIGERALILPKEQIDIRSIWILENSTKPQKAGLDLRAFLDERN
jgi:hypothetical protein